MDYNDLLKKVIQLKKAASKKYVWWGGDMLYFQDNYIYVDNWHFRISTKFDSNLLCKCNIYELHNLLKKKTEIKIGKKEANDAYLVGNETYVKLHYNDNRDSEIIDPPLMFDLPIDFYEKIKGLYNKKSKDQISGVCCMQDELWSVWNNEIVKREKTEIDSNFWIGEDELRFLLKYKKINSFSKHNNLIYFGFDDYVIRIKCLDFEKYPIEKVRKLYNEQR